MKLSPLCAILNIVSTTTAIAAPAHNFFWGAASAAFQVEGSPQASDWKNWTQNPTKIADGSNANVVTDFWNRYEEDFKIAHELGLNAYRLSIAWERIYPAKNKLDPSALKKYVKIIQKMREYGLEPIVTLHHFVLPQWLSDSGGLLSPDFVSAFCDYTRTVVSALSQQETHVKYWITFNEPNVLARGGYIEGDWPPGIKGDAQKANQATAQIIRAHVAAFNIIKGIDKKLQVSIAHHWRAFQAKNKWNLLDILAQKIVDWVWNDQIVSSLMSGKLKLWMPGADPIREDLNLIQKPAFDYLGINYYGRSLISFQLSAPFVGVEEGPGTKSDLGWEIYPQGLSTSLGDAYTRYRLPIMITENGIADSNDSRRADFIRDHIAALKEAQSSGVPVLGYFHWSLTDNFEWAKGLSPRFGLVEIDYEHKAQRKLRPSAQIYKQIVTQAQ